MIKQVNYDIEELGDKKKIIPGKEPVLTENEQFGVIRVCEPWVSSREAEYVRQAVSSGWISSRGEFLNKFESLFAEKVGAKYGVAVNSGTSALYLCMAAMDIKPGDEVIVPTNTMISTAYAVSNLGAIPVFVDCDEYYQIDIEKAKQAITPKTKAIVPVHIYGHPVDMDAIESLGIPVIYDAAESHGALYKDEPIGGRGVATCYSFYANKIITTGEGGMIVTNDKEFADTVRNMKDVSFSPIRHFWHMRPGYSFRMTNMQAAIGLAQTERFDELVNNRIFNALYYLSGLAGLPLRFPKNAPWAKNVYWMFGFEVLPEFGMTRDELRAFMADRGIETRTFFIPMHLQPIYFDHKEHNDYPISERVCERGMYIPSSGNISLDEMNLVITTIHDAFQQGSKTI